MPEFHTVSATPTDMIEGVDFDVDGGYGEDGRQVRAFLILEGDFVASCEAYLADEQASGISLRIDAGLARELVDKIVPYLGP